MDRLFDVLTALVLLKGLAGVWYSLRYHRYIRAQLSHSSHHWMPLSSVIIPCKGTDYELEKNVRAILNQDFEDYEVIFVTASERDIALPVLRQAVSAFPHRRVKFVVAGFSDKRGEKVNNLIQGIRQSDACSQVLVFADSDGRPHRYWLRDLLSPLRDPSVGASTGYRWFFPFRGNFASVLRSSWNGAISSLLGDHDHNFAWGGSMAIKRSTVEAVDLLAYWQGSISDDYSLTAAVRNAGLKIYYQPRCLVSSHGQCTWRELLEWSTRQIIITKVYAKRFWTLALLSELPFVLFWWWAVGQLVWLAWQVGRLGQSQSQEGLVVVFLVGTIFSLGVIRGSFRWAMIKLIHPEERLLINRDWWGYLLLGPLVATLTVYTLVISSFTSTVVWRNVRYDLISAQEVHVVRDC